jgi:hypothetical protein
MAAQVIRAGKSPADDHALELKADEGCDVYLVAGGRRRAYLWFGGKDGIMVDTISGEKALRAMAEAILKELDD